MTTSATFCFFKKCSYFFSLLLLMKSFILTPIQAKECEILPKPDQDDKLMTARWMVHTINSGIISTISTRTDLPSSLQNATIPFGNIYSFSDGLCDPSSSTGIPYIYTTELDQSMKDIEQNPIISLALTEASLPSSRACALNGFADPENPPCARVTITGRFVEVISESELEFAKMALFSRHPVMAYWPGNHEFFIGKIDIEDIWLLDWFGGASILDVESYFNVTLDVVEEKKTENDCWLFCWFGGASKDVGNSLNVNLNILEKRESENDWSWEDVASLVRISFKQNPFHLG